MKIDPTASDAYLAIAKLHIASEGAAKDESKLSGKLLVARPVLSELDNVGLAIRLFDCRH